MTSAACKSAGMGGRHAVLGLNAIDQMFFLPSYPFWSFLIIAANIDALCGLCAYRSRENIQVGA